MYSPIIPIQKSCIPPINSIKDIIVGYPGILIPINNFCTNTTIKYIPARSDNKNPCYNMTANR